MELKNQTNYTRNFSKWWNNDVNDGIISIYSHELENEESNKEDNSRNQREEISGL